MTPSRTPPTRGAQVVPSHQVREIDAQQAAARADEVLLLDVRDDDERAAGHAPQAVHLPLSALDRAAVPERRSGLDGQSLPDAASAGALPTWTPCTRPDPGVLRRHQRLDPVEHRVAAGCHLYRPVDALHSDHADGEPPDLDSRYRSHDVPAAA